MRGTLNLFFISSSSSLISFSSKVSLFKISSRRAISAISSANSASSFSRSRPVSLLSLISMIAFACSSLRPNFATNPSRALGVSALFLMSSITSSILSSAIFKPSKICALALAFSRSNIVRRMMTVFLWFKNSFKSSIRLNTFGSLLFIASIMTPKVLSIVVDLKRLFSTMSLIASRFSSMTTRMPSLSDSSRTSLMPSICFSLTSSAICSMRRALFV